MKLYIRIFFIFLLVLLWSSSAFAQMFYIPYYGKNKVLYTKFDWEHYKTDHFDVYFYTKDEATLKKVAEMAESAYLHVSNHTKHELSAPVPLLYYINTTDFQQTNLFNMPEGVLGVAEPLLYRVAVRGDMPKDELQELIIHELTHIFEYDLLYGSPGAAVYAVSRPPLWIFEGFSEYSTGVWSTWSSLIVRDSVLNDRIPELNERGDLFSRYPLPRDPAYDFGHALFDFIEWKYGRNGVRELWRSLKSTPLIGKREPVKRAFKMPPQQLSFEFKKYLRDRFKPFLLRENPDDYSIPITPSFPLKPYYFSFSHALSPSGDILAVMLFNLRAGEIDVILTSTKDGRIIKNITRGYTTKYERIKYEIDTTKGKDLAWAPDGDRIAFFVRRGEKYSLMIINALSGKTLKLITIPYDQPAAPSFFPDRDEIVFTAYDGEQHDIYKIDLATEKIENLTNDEFYQKSPVISPDGKHVAYSIRLNSFDKLFISPIEELNKKTQLTFDDANATNPEFSSDSQKIYFAGDMREAFNIYSLDRNTGDLTRYTDVRTGNFFPVPFPGKSNEIVFSSFNKGAFQAFKVEAEGEVEKTIAFAEIRPEEQEYKRFEPILSLDISKDKIKAHKGIGKLFLTARPPIEAILSTDGSIYGGTMLTFTDLLGDHTFNLMAYQVQSFRSYQFAYYNQKRRMQFMASAFQFTQFYYPDYYYYAPSFWNYLSYQDAIATRTIAGANAGIYYPFNRYYRFTASLGYSHYEEEFFDPYLAQSLAYSGRNYNLFWNGNLMSASFSLVGETTRFKYYGPAAGGTFRVTLSQALPAGDAFFNNTSMSADFRKYLYLGADTVIAFRWRGFASRGEDPFITYFGGNNEVRTAYYYSLIGTEGWFANLEFRIPLINAASTLIGQIGPVRGTVFLDMARTKVKGYPAQFFRFSVDPNDPENFILVGADALGSWGFGFQFFFLGFPIHLEFVKRLEIPDMSTPFSWDTIGSFRTKFWIGFDF